MLDTSQAVLHEGHVPLLTRQLAEVTEPHYFVCQAAYTGT